MKCDQCHREATMISPVDLCDLHWQLYIVEDLPGGPPPPPKYTLKRMIWWVREELRFHWKAYGRPRDWRSQWRAVPVEVT